jgi:hypothetical protein
MEPVKILVKIYHYQPSWVENYPKLLPSIYRLYVNNDLITERTWNYGNHNVLYEELHAGLTVDNEYTLRLEPVVKNPAQVIFKIDEFTTPDQPTTVINTSDLSVTFKLS